MSGIGSVSSLAYQAMAPMLAGSAASGVSTGDSGASSSSEATAATPSSSFTADYVMSLLAKITHASADQALALIQSMQTPVAPSR